uniref:Sorting nexin 11 n=1 Tax=Felis catus TaxID=9685 RepID=A0ABI8AHJ8_FELCA
MEKEKEALDVIERTQEMQSQPGSFVGSTYWLKSVFISRCFLPMGFCCRMLENQEQEEVITVRVQDPRVQNEGSWNSYVDYKIFLHTNSKAFTAKTSCVRRRYREFVWLRKQLQRNAGLVPVPELPGKSTFFGSSDEFIEKRRQGLQHFLEKVLQSVVLLSDSQLHLFLQSQLSVPEIEACVQGRSPMTVSDAILHYAMSNCGWVQEERRGSSHLAKGDQPKSCCFLPRSGRRSSPSPPPREEKDHFEVWAPVVDSEAPSLESPPLPPSPSPSCCDFTRPDEGTSAPQPVRRAMAGDHAVPLDPGQLETVVEK